MLWKNILRILTACAVSTILYVVNLTPDNNMFSTVFTVLSILFSVGIGIIVTFELNCIKSDSIYANIKCNIDHVFRNFLWYFAVFIILYLIGYYYIPKIGSYTTSLFSIDIDFYRIIVVFAFSVLVMGILYFTMNFVQLRKLKNEITTQLRNKTH